MQQTDPTAEEILAIPITEPERLFGPEEEVHVAYRRLALVWHTDRNASPIAADVMAHINLLHDEAQARIDAGTWCHNGTLTLHGTDGRTRRLRFRRRSTFELGETYCADTALVFVVRDEFRDLVDNAERAMRSFRYASQAMRQEMSRWLPSIVERFATPGGAHVMVIGKPADAYFLGDVLRASGGRLGAHHVGWILNTVYNVACYLEYAGIAHNAIALDTFLVSPKQHTGMLLGGWWFARPIGSAFAALPARSYDYVPVDVLRQNMVSHELDMILIRALGRELLGDPTGMTLYADRTIPRPVVDFLRGLPQESARMEYAAWSKGVLPNGFGARRFVELNLSDSDIYAAQ